jgi:hypothetical protein
MSAGFSTAFERCACCGGKFDAKRIWLHGQQYHPQCVMRGSNYSNEEVEAMARLIMNLARAIKYGEDVFSSSEWTHLMDVADKAAEVPFGLRKSGLS